MNAGFIHVGLSRPERRRMLATALAYWLALGGAALILALAVWRGAASHPPYLAARAESICFCATTAFNLKLEGDKHA